MKRVVLVVVALALVVAGAVGCGPSQPGPSGGPLAAFYNQRLTWLPCGTRVECATATVPLDYDDPDGPTLAVPVARRRASAAKLGTLFVNPGGPGESGTAFAAGFDATGLEHFDIVGWDLRGLGVTCLTTADADAFLDLDASPDTVAEASAYLAGSRAFGTACAKASGELLAHVSTQESARDLDVLRGAVREEQIDFYGASYGTLLGALYAEFFPGRVRHLVLDSPVDMTGGPSSVSGFESALGSFAQWCAGAGGCRWGSDRSSVVNELTAWARGLDDHPIAVGARTLTQTRAAWGVMALLYGGPSGHSTLRTAVEAAQDGHGEALLAASDGLLGRKPDGTYDAAFAALPAIYCADHARRTAADAQASWTAAALAEPFFGFLMGPDYTCIDWPAAPRPWVTPHAAGAFVLIVGATGDPVTPYAAARTLAETLSATLLTLEGGGHVSYGRNACVSAAVRARLNDESPPAMSTCS